MRNIENGKYWDFGWKLIEGCTPVSEGCLNCWSLGMEKRFGGGEVRFMADRLNRPLKRKKPAIYSIWNDLFHEALETGNVRESIDTIRQCPQHKFLALTKRARYMQKTVDYLTRTGCPSPDNQRIETIPGGTAMNPEIETKCEWKYYWDGIFLDAVTGCGIKKLITTDDRKRWVYCPYCGREIQKVAPGRKEKPDA